MTSDISTRTIMKRQFIALLLLFTFAVSITAQTAAPATDVDARLRKHVEYLASDKLAGRRTGQPGAAAAAEYIAESFAKAGLKPGVTGAKGKGSFMQPFPYVTGVEMNRTGNTFHAEAMAADGKRVEIKGISEARPVGFSPNGSVSKADVIFAGFGIVSTEPKYDDYKVDGQDVDVTGKVVAVFDGAPNNDDPHNALLRFDVRTKALIAKERGAAGLLLVSREASFADERLTRLAYDQTLGEAALPTFVISRVVAGELLGATEAELAAYEAKAAKQRDPSLSSEVIFRDSDPHVSFSVDLVKKRVDANNVIGVLEGTDKTLKNEAIVIGAHYDHLGRGGQGSLAANSTEVHHGADDNASGTAALIELARTFAAEKGNLRTLIFIAFSGEEEGLLGSKHYVNNPIFPLERTVAMLNLDMVGRLTNNRLNVGGVGTASEFRQLVEQINTGDGARMRVMRVPPKFELALNEDGFGPSDHSSFYGKKVPVLFFFTGTHTDYHKPTDTAEKINYEGLAKVKDLVLEITHEIDRNPARPAYTVAKSSGMMGGRSSFNVSLGTIPSYADATDGMVLDGVRDNSPASKAGLKPGDKVVKLAGIEIRNVVDYTYALGEMKAGEEYEIEVVRGSERMTLKIVPVKR